MSRLHSTSCRRCPTEQIKRKLRRWRFSLGWSTGNYLRGTRALYSLGVKKWRRLERQAYNLGLASPRTFLNIGLYSNRNCLRRPWKPDDWYNGRVWSIVCECGVQDCPEQSEGHVERSGDICGRTRLDRDCTLSTIAARRRHGSCSTTPRRLGQSSLELQAFGVTDDVPRCTLGVAWLFAT